MDDAKKIIAEVKQNSSKIDEYSKQFQTPLANMHH